MSDGSRFGRRLAVFFLLLVITIFCVGVAAFNWYVTSDDFNRRFDRLRGKLAKRGITLGSMNVGKLGRIEISDFSINLGSLGDISVSRLKGRVEILSLLSGRVRTTFDISEIVRQFIKKRFGNRFRLLDGADLLFSFEGDVRRLRDLGDIEGELAVSKFRLVDNSSDLKVYIDRAGLSLRAPGPVLSMRKTKVRIFDRVFSFSGSIRNILQNPEFVGAMLEARLALKPDSKRIIDSFNDPEVSRKVGMAGKAHVSVSLTGPVVAPRIEVDFRIPDYVLQFRGQFRQIMLRYDWVNGKLTFSEGWEHPRIECVIRTGPTVLDYSELKALHLPHLFFRMQEGFAQVVYKAERLEFRRLNVKAYDGVLAARLNIDLRRKPVHFNWNLVLNKLKLNRMLTDIAHLDGFLDGRISAGFEGWSKTLMLERMIGSGKVRIDKLCFLGFPDKERLLLKNVKRVLPGADFGKGVFDFKLDHAFIDAMKIQSTGKDGIFSGFMHYNILTLDLQAGFALELGTSFTERHRLIKNELPKKRLEMVFRGRVTEPHVSYTPAASPLPGTSR